MQKRRYKKKQTGFPEFIDFINIEEVIKNTSNIPTVQNKMVRTITEVKMYLVAWYHVKDLFVLGLDLECRIWLCGILNKLGFSSQAELN